MVSELGGFRAEQVRGRAGGRRRAMAYMEGRLQQVVRQCGLRNVVRREHFQTGE